MYCTYRLKQTFKADEQGKIHTVYGVEAVDVSGTVLTCVEDIFFDYAPAANFIAMCNKLKIPLIHLHDVIEDALTEQYAI